MLAPAAPASPVARRQRGRRPVNSRLNQRLVTEGLDGGLPLVRGDTGKDPSPASGVNEVEVHGAEIPVGAGQPEGRDGNHHQPRVACGIPGEVQPPQRHLPRRKIVDEQIGVFQQPFQFRLAGGLPQIQHEAALAGIESEE